VFGWNFNAIATAVAAAAVVVVMVDIRSFRVWRFNENGRRGCTWCSNFRVVHCPHIILTPTHVVKIYGKYRKKDKLNSEKIWKIQKKIVKLYGKYGRKAGG
jgi:hypothetical protein